MNFILQSVLEILSCKNKNKNCEIKVYNKNNTRFKVEQIKMKWWACGPHTQTVCQYFQKTPKVKYEREFVCVQNKLLILDWLYSRKNQTIIIFPGIGGKSTDISVLHLAHDLSKYYNVCVHQRSIDILSSSDNFDEINFIVNYIGNNPILIGISASGNMVLKYAGIMKEKCKLGAVVAISNAVDLIPVRTQLSLDRKMDKFLYEKIDVKFQQSSLIGLEKAMILAQNAKHNIYKYYDDNSSVHFLKDIRIPTLYVGSRDDPIINNEQIDIVKKAVEQNYWITCVETSLGGHLGWTCICGDDDEMWWLSRIIRDYLVTSFIPSNG